MTKFVKLIVRALKGGCSMDKDIKNFIATRCQEALTENADYMKKERSGNVDQSELQVIAEDLCYRKGYDDAVAIMLKSTTN